MNLNDLKVKDLIRYEYDTTTMCHPDSEWRYSIIKLIEERFHPITGIKYNLYITSKGKYDFDIPSKKGLNKNWEKEVLSESDFINKFKDSFYIKEKGNNWVKRIFKLKGL